MARHGKENIPRDRDALLEREGELDAGVGVALGEEGLR
jgi:hypothetical protein